MSVLNYSLKEFSGFNLLSIVQLSMFCVVVFATTSLDYHIFHRLSTTFFIFFCPFSQPRVLCDSSFIIAPFFLSVKQFFKSFFAFFYSFFTRTTLGTTSVFYTIFCIPFLGSLSFNSGMFKTPQRRKRDLNPRAATNDLLPFQGSPFSLLGISHNNHKAL